MYQDLPWLAVLWLDWGGSHSHPYGKWFEYQSHSQPAKELCGKSKNDNRRYPLFMNDTVYLLNTKQNSYNFISIAQNQGQMGTWENKVHGDFKINVFQGKFSESRTASGQSPTKVLVKQKPLNKQFLIWKNVNVCMKRLHYQHGLILNMSYLRTVV